LTLVARLDITRAMEAARAASESERKFRNLIENSVQGVLIHRFGRPLFCNRAFAQMFGFSGPDEVLAMPSIFPLFVLENRDRAMTTHRRRMEGANLPNSYQHAMLRKDGSRFWIEARLSTTDWDGEPAVQATVIDISERRQIERMKDDFISTVSHELRTPLTSISGSLGLIAAGMAGAVAPDAGRLVTIAHRNSERLVRLINDILDLEKIESGNLAIRLEPLGAAGLAQAAIDAMRGYAAEFDSRLVLEVLVGDALVLSSHDQLMQVFSNLLSNAIKFSPRGSVITLAVTRQGRAIRFGVRDRGPGVPPEVRQRIFERFVQADVGQESHRAGTGLGLSICRALIDRLGGTIDFTSSAQGSEFFFLLPEHEPLDRTRPLVLVCEDDADTATLITLVLEQAGYDTTVVARLGEAREKLAAGSYAAITVDLALPDGSGLVAIRELRAQPGTRNLPVVVISATADLARLDEQNRNLGNIAWVNKPIDRQRLIAVLGELLRAKTCNSFSAMEQS